MKPTSVLGNILWLICGGLPIAFEYAIGGLLTCLTIIGIPFGLQAFKLAGLSFLPFGKKVIETPDFNNAPNIVLNILWLIFFGWEIALTHLTFGILLAITIVGLPWAKQHFKLIALSLWPFGREVVDSEPDFEEVIITSAP